MATIDAENCKILIDYLVEMRWKASYVVFDPQEATGWRRHVWPFEQVIQHLRDNKELQ